MANKSQPDPSGDGGKNPRASITGGAEREQEMYPMNWPDYLFRVIHPGWPRYYDAVHGANLIIVTQRGKPLWWH